MAPTKKALVLGAGGFIGSHMCKRLKSEGFWVRGVDIKYPEFSESAADEFIQGDLREVGLVARVLDVEGDSFDQIYQFAADMGGAGYIFTDEHSADIMHNSATINLNVLNEQVQLNRLLGTNKTKIFYSSSACMYPEHNQLDPDNPDCREDSAYPANPDSEYGWEKLFSERLYQQLSAARLRMSQMWEARLKCGATGCRQDPSSTSTSASKLPDDLWTQQPSEGPLISDPKKWLPLTN